jgi:hypothetical protein
MQSGVIATAVTGTAVSLTPLYKNFVDYLREFDAIFEKEGDSGRGYKSMRKQEEVEIDEEET